MPDYFFPGNLPNYATRINVPLNSEARLTATVLSRASGTILIGVHADDYASFAAGLYDEFTLSVDVTEEGFIASAWAAVSEVAVGTRCIGVIARTSEVGDVTTLVVGLAEVQIRKIA